MVDSVPPELELSPWEGHLGEVEVACSFSGPMPIADAKRPRIIASAAGPPLPDGSNRRKRLFIVEPLGMWVKNGQPVPVGTPSSASASPTTAHDVAAEPLPEHLRLSASPLEVGPSMLINGAHDMELRSRSDSPSDGQTPGGGTLPTALAPPQRGEQQYQQQYHQQQHYKQQQQQLEPTPEDSGYQGPMRRLAASPGFPQPPLASSRFQPYPGRNPSSSSTGLAALASRMMPGSGGGGLPLLPPLPLLNSAGVGGGGPPGDDVLSTLLQRQGSSWMREAGLCRQQLLQMQWQQSREGQLTAARPPAGAAVTSLWHTWMRGEEVPLDLAGGIGGLGGGGDFGGGVPLYNLIATSVRPLGQVVANTAAAAAAGTDHLPPHGPAAAAPPLQSPATAAAISTLHLQQLRLQQHLLHQQHQQREAAAAGSHRPPPGSDAWSSGGAEIWAAAFGEAAPGMLVPHRVPQLAEGGIAAGRGRGGMRAFPQEPAPRP